MNVLKAIQDNYLLVAAILFVLLLILYAVFYKKIGKKEEVGY
jgi:F0F1-type ATP synthase membrane subunit b/b'